MSLLRIADVHKSFRRGRGPIVSAVDGVSLAVERGETVGLIGESGSGKSTLARVILGLLPADAGSIDFEGNDLTSLDRESIRKLRSRMTIVFQEPYRSLNPRQTIGKTVEEPLTVHEPGLSRSDRRRRSHEALEQVALPANYFDRFPHELSGGQQQRVGIARAIVTRPTLVVLDEPTSSLDLSVRAQILQLLADLQSEYRMGYLLISHDLPTVEYVADKICVIYLGRLVETGPAAEVMNHPKHPYTKALVASSLSPDPDVKAEYVSVVGDNNNEQAELHHGCVFHSRCPIGTEECTVAPVPLRKYADDHDVACIKVAADA